MAISGATYNWAGWYLEQLSTHSGQAARLEASGVASSLRYPVVPKGERTGCLLQKQLIWAIHLW